MQQIDFSILSLTSLPYLSKNSTWQYFSNFRALWAIFSVFDIFDAYTTVSQSGLGGCWGNFRTYFLKVTIIQEIGSFDRDKISLGWKIILIFQNRMNLSI